MGGSLRSRQAPSARQQLSGQGRRREPPTAHRSTARRRSRATQDQQCQGNPVARPQRLEEVRANDLWKPLARRGARSTSRPPPRPCQGRAACPPQPPAEPACRLRTRLPVAGGQRDSGGRARTAAVISPIPEDLKQEPRRASRPLWLLSRRCRADRVRLAVPRSWWCSCAGGEVSVVAGGLRSAARRCESAEVRSIVTAGRAVLAQAAV